MLILDVFHGHTTVKIKKLVAEMNNDRFIIPGEMTSYLQVLDVVVNEPLKVHLQKNYSDWLINGNDALTPTGLSLIHI